MRNQTTFLYTPLVQNRKRNTDKAKNNLVMVLTLGLFGRLLSEKCLPGTVVGSLLLGMGEIYAADTASIFPYRCSIDPCEENVLACLKAHPEPCISREPGETWPLMQNPDCVESLGPPRCNPEPTERCDVEEEGEEGEEEEGCTLSEDTQEKPTDQSQEKTGALTEVLLPKQQPSSLEGQWCLAVRYDL